MEKLKQSPAEILKEVVIKPIEMECLDRVFAYLSKFNMKSILTCCVVSKGKFAMKFLHEHHFVTVSLLIDTNRFVFVRR